MAKPEQCLAKANKDAMLNSLAGYAQLETRLAMCRPAPATTWRPTSTVSSSWPSRVAGTARSIGPHQQPHEGPPVQDQGAGLQEH